jgi:hypothetical protein
MCIKYPFLYPRNRYDNKYHAGLLTDKYNNLHKQSIQEVLVYADIKKTDIEYFDSVEIDDVKANLDTDKQYIIISNNVETKKFKTSDYVWGDKFQILGLTINKNWFNYPMIKIIVKVKDEKDNTNYGFTRHVINLIKNKKLYKRSQIINWIDTKILDRIFILPTFDEWDNVEPGWNKAFGKQYLDELKKQLKKDKLLYKFRITQIKEKWGKFQLYCYNGSNKVHDIINKYEQLSWDYCKCCGKPAEVISTGWISPYCKECAEKYNLKYVEKNKKNNNL